MKRKNQTTGELLLGFIIDDINSCKEQVEAIINLKLNTFFTFFLVFLFAFFKVFIGAIFAVGFYSLVKFIVSEDTVTFFERIAKIFEAFA